MNSLEIRELERRCTAANRKTEKRIRTVRERTINQRVMIPMAAYMAAVLAKSVVGLQ